MTDVPEDSNAGAPNARRASFLRRHAFTIAVGAAIVVVLPGPIPFLGGLTETMWVVYFIGVAAQLCTLGFLIASIVLFATGRRDPRHRKAARRCLLLCALSASVAQSGVCVDALDGFAYRMRLTADFGAIRQWAQGVTLPAEPIPPSHDKINIYRARWPKCIDRLSPSRVMVSQADRTVTLEWGRSLAAGLAYRYLAIGPSAAPPRARRPVKLADDAYVWYGQ